MRRMLFAALLLCLPTTLAAQTNPTPFKLDFLEDASKPVAVQNPRQIEEKTGGRLGIALVDAQGKLLLGFNREERFAMCSTFKAPLAAAVLMGAEQGRYGMDGTLPITKEDVLEHAPVVKANLKKGRMRIAELAKAAVEVSDNSAANILLPIVGGPEGLTGFLRAHGDTVTRLDRNEPALNENAQGDERDTTSPVAMATVMARLMFQDMPASAAAELRAWLEGSTTGNARIRAGLPDGWRAGDKTGSCGTAYNDVAVLRSPSGQDYVLAIYLDRPTVKAKDADAAIADATRAAMTLLTQIEKRNGL